MLRLGRFGAGGALKGDIAVKVMRVANTLTFEEFSDGENLQARIFILVVERLVEVCGGGFGAHGLSGLFESDEDADLGFFAFDDPAQVTDVRDVHVAGFYGQNNLLGRTALALVVEI